jgi:hypothetical protein
LLWLIVQTRVKIDNWSEQVAEIILRRPQFTEVLLGSDKKPMIRSACSE